MTPIIRLIVVNYNGGDMTVRCLKNLVSSAWPEDRMELVMVDNAGHDGVAERVEVELPQVRILRSPRNLGFAGGANLGMQNLDGVDYVGFVNNDAFPEAGWLHPLVEAMLHDPAVGAAAPKILLAPRFARVAIRSGTFRPGGGDGRSLGVTVSGVRVGGRDRFAEAIFRRGFWGPESGADGAFQWTNGEGELWCPFDAKGTGPDHVELQLRSADPSVVELCSVCETTEEKVDAEPAWHQVRLADAFDVINNVGTQLVAGGWAGDRGFLERDEGQYDASEEVFGWCGAAALTSARYLQDVGHFDDRFFLYYEDTDLSWRGRLRGWTYRYVPESRVRHVHSATTGEGSRLFNHFVDRNRLLMYLRNAPPRMAVEALGTYLRETTAIATRDVVKPTFWRHQRQPERTVQKLRSFGGFLRLAPITLVDRVGARREIEVPPKMVSDWAQRR